MFKFKKRNLIPSAVFVVLLLLFSSFIPALRNPLLDAFKFPLYLFNFVKQEITGIIFYHHNMVRNERLNREADVFKRKLNEANEFYQENIRLKKLLSLKANTTLKVIAAAVIARLPDSWTSVAIINKGLHHGVKKGYVVMNYLGLVGRIVEAGEYSARVMLINDIHIGVSAIVSRSRQEGLISGTLGNTLLMRYLPRDCDVQISDTVVTSGLIEGFPKGLLIGTVVSIGEEFSGLSKYAIIKPAVDLSNIEEVLIIVP